LAKRTICFDSEPVLIIYHNRDNIEGAFLTSLLYLHMGYTLETGKRLPVPFQFMNQWTGRNRDRKDFRF
jgi:hypothetical protein